MASRPFFSGWPASPLPGRLGEFAADEGGAGAEGMELGAGEIATEGDHAAVGAGEDLRGLDVAHRLADDRGHLLGRLHAIARHVDGPDQHVLVAEEPEKGHGNVRIGALEGDAADAALREQREGPLVLPPLRAQGLLPVRVGLDAAPWSTSATATASRPTRTGRRPWARSRAAMPHSRTSSM